MVALPLFIIYATFLFNKWTALFATLASMGAATLIYYLGGWKMLDPAKYTDEANWKVLLVLLLAAGAFVWAVMNSRERVVQNLRDTYDLTLSGWAHALEYRDHETEGHSQYVMHRPVKPTRFSGEIPCTCGLGQVKGAMACLLGASPREGFTNKRSILD